MHTAPDSFRKSVPHQRRDDDGGREVDGDRSQPDPGRLVTRRERHKSRDQVDVDVRLRDRRGDVHDEEH
jgi:hypothetical protein